MQDTSNEQTNGQPPEETGSTRLLSADKLAERLDISVRTLWRLRAVGKLPAPIRLGGSVRWRLDTIQSWIEAGCPATESR